jgi:succinate dehydrogenase hydrophobic anchor subunit
VRANPLPLLQWSRYNNSSNDSEPLINAAVQVATGFNEMAFSFLSLNITELGIGIHSFQCTATVHTPMTQSETSSTETTITINPLLNIISIVPEMQTFIADGNSNDTVELNCSVLASPAPSSVQWLVNGVEFQGRSVVSAGSIVFYSILELSYGELELGENNVTCSAFQDAVAPPINAVDTATITVNSMLVHGVHGMKWILQQTNTSDSNNTLLEFWLV